MGRERQLVIGAFAVIYFVWGSTYLANYWAIQTIPPFLMCGGRFLVAGTLLFAFTATQKAPWPTWKQWGNATLMGILFLALGTASTVWAEQFIPTSLVALIVAFDPLLIMLLMWTLIGSKPSNKAFFGAFISIIGVFMLVEQPQITGGWDSIRGLLAISLALTAWALGSIYISRVDMGKDRARGTAMQMITGGLLILLFSLSIGEPQNWDIGMIDTRSLLSWLYLITFGS
ncbi:MAG: EamA family transporter, partial [Bacteroidota bacterium]